MQKLLFILLFSAFAFANCKKTDANGIPSNATKTPNGSFIVNHSNGSGAKPTYGDVAMLEGTVWLRDTMMASSYKNGRPIRYRIPEQSEIEQMKSMASSFEPFMLMGVGDSATIWMPIDSSIKKMLPKGFENVQYMRREMKLTSMVTKAEMDKQKAEQEAAAAEQVAKEYPEKIKMVPAALVSQTDKLLKDYTAGTLGNKLQKSETGLELVILSPGSGENLKMGETVKTTYFGVLKTTGKMFDASYLHGGPQDFPVGQLVPGFNEGLMKLKRGAKAYFIIPSKLGYGERSAGAIPANSDLVFYVEIGK